MNIVEATKSYEAWVGARTRLLKADLALKHERMREELFPFLRATDYRWAQVWPKVCAECARDPVVLAVGDLHVENFGTWRDVDGRLVWGINDLDECYPLPFSHDLTRLAVSADLAIETGELALAPKEAAAAILDGYRASLKAGGWPLILADASTPLRTMAGSLEHAGTFLEEAGESSARERGGSRGSDAVDPRDVAGAQVAAAVFAPGGGTGEPGEAALHGGGHVAGRADCARGEGVVGVGVLLGGGAEGREDQLRADAGDRGAMSGPAGAGAGDVAGCGGCRRIVSGLS